MTRWRRIYYVVPVAALAIPLVANEYLLWVVNAMLVYSLVTVGFNIVIGNLGQLAFANTAFFGIGAYTTAILMVYLGFPYPLAIVASAIAGGVAGLLASVAALRGIRLYYLAIITPLPSASSCAGSICMATRSRKGPTVCFCPRPASSGFRSIRKRPSSSCSCC